jgi:hypothetical protein
MVAVSIMAFIWEWFSLYSEGGEREIYLREKFLFVGRNEERVLKLLI